MLRNTIQFLFFLLLAFAMAVSVYAGGGPAGVLVVYDQDDPVSLAVANHYRQVRGIPERNMVPVTFQAPFEGENVRKFVDYLRAQIDQRGLSGQLQGFALAGYTPLGCNRVNGGQVSLASVLYDAPNTDPKAFPKDGQNKAFRLPPTTPTIALNSFTPLNGATYWPVSLVGPTDRAAFSPRAALAAITQAKAADGSKPDGIVYWPLNGDIRSTTRESQLSQVLPLWDKMGLKYSVLDGTWVAHRGDIVGGVVGIAVTDTAQDNRYLPGAWVDHLTSYGGVLFDNWQTPCTDFLQAGAAGSAGTMAEPYAIPGKFPHAHIYTHFRNGASLAEAFWESIQWMNEILPVGDPLLQPFATFPGVVVTTPKVNAVLRGTVQIRTKYTATQPLDANADLFIDGRRVRIAEAAETAKVIRTADGFTLDTTSIPDGWHELRVVVYTDNAIRTQGEAVVSCSVANHRQMVRLTGPALVNCAEQNTFQVKLENLPTLAGISLRANGQVLGTAPGAGLITVPGKLFPYTGICQVYAVASLPDKTEIWSTPLSVQTVLPALLATPKPLLSTGIARLRYYADTTGPNFTWEAMAPTGEIVATDGQFANHRFDTNNTIPLPGLIPDWGKVDYSKHPGLEYSGWFYAVHTDLYEFLYPGAVMIDGKEMSREKNGLVGPLPLAAGWHRLLLRTTLGDKNFSLTLMMRGGAVTKLTAMPLAWCSAPAEAIELPAPVVTITKAGVMAPTSLIAPGVGALSVPQSILAAGTTLTLAAKGDSPNLTYSWTVLDAPRIGAVNHPDEGAAVALAPNGTKEAHETTATFAMAGQYLLRVYADNGPARGYADVRVIVQPVVTALSMTTAHGPAAVVTRGNDLDLYAAILDQFGRRYPGALPVSWSTTSHGTFNRLSPDAARFHASDVDGQFQITASALGKTNTLTVAITPNHPPKLGGTINWYPNGKNAVQFSDLAQDVDNPRFPKLTYRWAVEKLGEGQKLDFGTPEAAQTLATITGNGSYTVSFTATSAGVSATDTLTFKVATREDGSLVFSPAARLVDSSALITQEGFIWSQGYAGPGATFVWETSTDGTTWQPVPEGKTQSLRYGPVTAKDNGRLFRVTVTNIAGSATSNAAKITVRDPVGGLIVCDQAPGIAKQGGNSVAVVIHRQAHAAGKMSVEYLTRDQYAGVPQTKWAKNGVDYTETKGKLVWEDGDATDRTILIPLLHVKDDAPGRGLMLFLQNPNGAGEVTRGFSYIWLPGPDDPTGPKLR